MIACRYDVESAFCLPFIKDGPQKIQGTKRIPRALDEAGFLREVEENLISEFCRRAHSFQGVPETNHAEDVFLEREVTTHAASHALADQNRSRSVLLFPLGKGLGVRFE